MLFVCKDGYCAIYITGDVTFQDNHIIKMELLFMICVFFFYIYISCLLHLEIQINWNAWHKSSLANWISVWFMQKFSHNCCIGGNHWDLFSSFFKWPHPIWSFEISWLQMYDFFLIFNPPLNTIYAHLNEPHSEIIFGMNEIHPCICEINPAWGTARVWPKGGTFKTKSPFPFILKH